MNRFIHGRRDVRILDFDIETRRIGFHNAGPFSPDGCEPIAIGWSWVGEDRVHVRTLLPTWSVGDMLKMFGDFRDAFGAADIVTGHYIRKFDLPILAGVAFEFGFEPLGAKLTSDTQKDLRPMAGLSKSQENLGDLLALEESKFHMNDNRWRDAARLTPEGLAKAAMRVRDDVIQHKAIRAELVRANALRAPRMWVS